MTKFTNNKPKAFAKAHAFLGAAFVLLIALIFTGCPNSAGGSGSSGGAGSTGGTGGSSGGGTGGSSGGGTPPADKTYTVGGVQFTMKGIAAVTNGTVGHSAEFDNAPHTVSLTAYRIGETEVTQELWQAVMGTNPSNFSGSPEGSEVQGKRPVENVNWYQCIAFCNKLSKACNLDPCYTVTGINFDTLNFGDIPTSNNTTWNNAVCDWSKKGFRLPTEAEWEWAAMGGTEHKWAGTDSESELGNYAWYYANGNEKTHQVKLKLPNGYGLYDMTGNVDEWCWDWYSNTTPTGGQDPAGAASGDARVERGGNWSSGAVIAARACRGGNYPGPSGLGLRLVSRP